MKFSMEDEEWCFNCHWLTFVHNQSREFSSTWARMFHLEVKILPTLPHPFSTEVVWFEALESINH